MITKARHHEESTQVAVDCIGFGVLLVAVLGDSSCSQDQAVETEDWEAQE